MNGEDILEMYKSYKDKYKSSDRCAISEISKALSVECSCFVEIGVVKGIIKGEVWLRTFNKRIESRLEN